MPTADGRDRCASAGSGTVPYREALAVQQALFDHGREQHLLLLEHPHVFTYGPRSDLAANLRCDPAAVGADSSRVRPRRRHHVPRPGPARRLPDPVGRQRGSARPTTCATSSSWSSTRWPTFGVSTPAGSPSTRACGSTPTGPNPRKICAIGVRLKRRPHDARLRPQRRDRPDVHARAHRRRAASPTGP